MPAPSATPITLPYSAAQPSGSTLEWYSFVAASLAHVVATLKDSPTPANGLSDRLTLFDSTGALLGTTLQGGNLDGIVESWLDFDLAPGTYYLAVTHTSAVVAPDWSVTAGSAIGSGVQLDVTQAAVEITPVGAVRVREDFVGPFGTDLNGRALPSQEGVTGVVWSGYPAAPEFPGQSGIQLMGDGTMAGMSNSG